MKFTFPRDIAASYRPETADVERFDLATIKERICEHFNDEFGVPIHIYGPQLEELVRLDKEILFPSKQDTDKTEKIFNFLINLSDFHRVKFDVSYLGGERLVLNHRLFEIEKNRIFLIKEEGRKGHLDIDMSLIRNDLFQANSELLIANDSLDHETLSHERVEIGKEIPEEFANIITVDSVMIDLIKLAKFYSSAAEHMLILGETGTGKELFAQAIHNVRKKEGKKSNFVALNCAAIPHSLAEAQLFGYNPGAYTDASKDGFKGLVGLADNGTLFLDEFGELSPELQAKLLRTIDTGRYMRLGAEEEEISTFKLICATNKNLANSSRFRQDLFFRVSKLPIRIPSLRERGKADIAKLSEFFLDGSVKSYKTHSVRDDMIPDLKDPSFYFTIDAMNEISKYEWPGNVRQLSAFVLKLVYKTLFQIQENRKTLEKDGRIKLDFDDIIYLLREEKKLYMNFVDNKDLSKPLTADPVTPDTLNTKLFKVDLESVGDINIFLQDIEREYLEAALAKWGNQTAIGNHLNMPQPTVRYRLKKYGILEKK